MKLKGELNLKKQKTKDFVINVIIEIPKGSRNKYEYDFKNGVLRFDRMLFSSVHYPTDYGFITETLAEDGDPLDALVIVGEPTFPGCLIEAKPIGMLIMSDEKGIDEKILCVPCADPLWRDTNTLSKVPQHLLKEIEHFFSIYKDLEGKKTKMIGWRNKREAIKVIKKYQKQYKKHTKKIMKP